ncbi:lysis system i-spanin subunit Rz [Pseudomonas chlororaphis]|uniref:lysis system i-spanin subunit Rz n=1 Tax=Pseudomonas chlororaphis TaxID=587753 RepID=UPI001B31F892|nr:lysis system i-spanin subunit Rz [Pseudomonas chlororaphis]MBP5059753.1 lysis protein [Pseudomonas chlororaphis]MBP5143897.1 lysis protein [Pseudomonas chlororaphis]
MIRYLIAALAACLVLIYGGWQRIDSLGNQVKQVNKDLAQKTADAKALQQSLTVRDSIDAQYQEALNNAESTKAQLVADLRTGVKRVYVRAACPQLPDSKSTGSAHAAAPELEPDARQDYADLREANDKVMAQVVKLQNYIAKACLKKN